ncbi:hypothetical protein GLAREA_05070 [Glarea lozoyensis ATCC 20868]|uniref:Uncharacterized protein n=1 Tax=Glarea lozoyensis (strain ATCC 20868 / MF5171) TaxID=1116229 RepID=S3EBQ2_GLAL2|nr:uncharacterized protein GLAREA_05070 [Glarea lozoyensis ATCC 20868]EPE35733.1 hypothetical protein GLAREA_05070 [Glarea lozoyensis ATCC 20868]
MNHSRSQHKHGGLAAASKFLRMARTGAAENSNAGLLVPHRFSSREHAMHTAAHGPWWYPFSSVTNKNSKAF